MLSLREDLFVGYLIICEDKDEKLFYLRNDFKKGKSFFEIKSMNDVIFMDHKIHKMELEKNIEKYIFLNNSKIGEFKVKIIVPIFNVFGKPYMGRMKALK